MRYGSGSERWVDNGDGSFTRSGQPSAPAEPDATPGAAEAAEELGVDLDAVKGSGKGGRVTKADVEAAVA